MYYRKFAVVSQFNRTGFSCCAYSEIGGGLFETLVGRHGSTEIWENRRETTVVQPRFYGVCAGPPFRTPGLSALGSEGAAVMRFEHTVTQHC